MYWHKNECHKTHNVILQDFVDVLFTDNFLQMLTSPFPYMIYYCTKVHLSAIGDKILINIFCPGNIEGEVLQGMCEIKDGWMRRFSYLVILQKQMSYAYKIICLTVSHHCDEVHLWCRIKYLSDMDFPGHKLSLSPSG